MDSIFSYFNSTNSLTKINNSEVFKIMNILNNISKDISVSKKLNIPSLVMIGSQSSGKSSLLNKILNMDILPTGSKMVTRTPLNLELINTKSDFFIEFGEFNNNSWNLLKKINLTTPRPTEDEIVSIKYYIEQMTKKKAGTEMNISSEEINLKIYSPKVVNINLIDLPGLTMIACTDKGQPKDIKEQIQNLVKKYISNPNNIILCVMPAREDIETDIALEFTKKYDKNGSRTIGILTKVDLMNKGSNISSYLENNISKDLKVKYGYYAINNNTSDDYNYFINHEIYKELSCKEKFGIVNLSEQLSSILLKNIKDYIPELLVEIDELYNNTIETLNHLGSQLPTDKNNLNHYITKFIINLAGVFNNSIDSKKENINTGRQLKEIFIKYRNEIEKINPFSKENYHENDLVNIIKNSDGNHMSFPVPTIEVLENCLKDKKLNCFRLLEPISLECCEDIVNVLKELIVKIFEINSMNRFPKLNKLIIEDIKKELIDFNKENTCQKIKEIISIEENYIWTDDEDFKQVLKEISNNMLTVDILRKILTEYYKTFIKNIQNNVPKIIMLFLVKQIQSNIQLLLLNNISKQNYVNYLIEDKSIIEKRITLSNIIKNLEDAKNILTSI